MNREGSVGLGGDGRKGRERELRRRSRKKEKNSFLICDPVANLPSNDAVKMTPFPRVWS